MRDRDGGIDMAWRDDMSLTLDISNFDTVVLQPCETFPEWSQCVWITSRQS